jgi:Domain of unknown function (DUF4388)
MSIAGNLKTMDLAELLQWLSQSRKTGTLVINNGKVEKRLFLKEGRIISSASSDPKEYLGRFLVSHSLIDEKQLTAAIKQQPSKKMLLGEILVTEGAMDEETLNRVLKIKAEEGIYDIFTWQNGEFRFLQGELPDHKFIPLSLDLTAILMEGARRVDEWVRMREVIPDLHAIPVSVTDLSGQDLPPAAQRILKLVDDRRTVEEIQEETHATAFFVCKVLFDQARKAKVKLVLPRIVEVKVEVEVPAREPDQQRPQPQPSRQQPPPDQQQHQQQQPPGYGPPPQQGYGAFAGQGPGGQPPPRGGYAPYPGAAPGQQYPPQQQGAHQGPSAPPPAPPVESLETVDPSQLDPNSLLAAASQNIAQGEYDRAMRYLRAVKSVRPGDRDLEAAVISAQHQIKAAIERSGLALNKVPQLAVSMDKLTSLDVSAQEGFILTRIDGTYDLKSILKISPMPETDALILFDRLYKAGHIKV